MDRERLRVPSDSSSGSSSRGGASPTLSGYRNVKPTYLLANNVVPPPNTPASFSPLIPSSPRGLPPPPGLTHPNLGSVYHFQQCTAPGFHNINNYPVGMSISGNSSHVPGHFSAVTGAHSAHYHMNGYQVQNGIYHPQVPSHTPPPGYSCFSTPSPNLSQGCSVHLSQQQTCDPFNTSQHVPYNQSGESYDFEQNLNLLLNSTSTNAYEGSGRCLESETLSSLCMTRNEEMSEAAACVSVSSNKEDKQICKPLGVMNPIIENLVGSMSMSNGTYTHFGPSPSSTSSSTMQQNGKADLLNEAILKVRQNGCVEQDRKSFSSHISVPQTKEIIVNEHSSLSNHGMKQPINQIQISTANENFDKIIHTPVTSIAHPRASTPKESTECSSRPQTPGKPSYLEVLTKAGLKNQQGTGSIRMTSSTSSSPVQSSFIASLDSAPVPNLSHRKSIDYFIASTSSTPSSSCPSASSSPATKPRNLASGYFKGKENVTSATANYVKQSPVSRSSPTSSPTHNLTNQNQPSKSKFQHVANVNVSSERKVLSSQNSSVGVKQGKGLKNGRVSTEKSLGVEDSFDDGDLGWKTYARGRNNNLNSVGNKNSQKRMSNGNCGSESSISPKMSVDNNDDTEGRNISFDDVVTERKPYSTPLASNGSSSTTVPATHSRKQRDKEKSRNRKEDRHCVSRRLENLAYLWLTHMISALTWLWSLITDVATLSASLGMSLIQDLYVWTTTKALPNFSGKISGWRKDIRGTCEEIWHNCRTKLMTLFSKGGPKNKRPEEAGNTPGGGGGGGKSGVRHDENILSLLGPERNISLPANGDEALKRLLSVKGQDPYSILGVRSDSSEETIRRYYKRQAVLVHPDKNLIVGAEEAFKILARAFEMVGDPNKRTEYHQKLMEAQAKEKFCGEIGNLLEQLRKKMEAASSTIRCTKCNSRHKKNLTDRPLFAARYCSQCRIHHGAREGELWAERGGWFGIAWNYFACMDAHVWEINEWAKCQKTNLKHIKADAHCVMYRLVAGGNNQQNHHNQHCHASSCDGDDRFGAGSEADEWDSLINNLCKSPSGSAFGKNTSVPTKPGCCNSGSAGVNANGNGGNNGSSNQATGKRRKGKRNK